ncbi:hypothetical protein SDC9_180093 [bioreactor metagenome]|uniref:Uncharacterized protein n=1 Tax=bioreactor metagenome TaxID=1076179 RepID=A0A645H9Z9_9ZZZZ
MTGATKVTTKRTVKTRTRKPLGQRITQTKVTGIENNGTLTVDHYETARFNSMLDEYEATGKMPEFDLQIVNEDEGSIVGRRVVRYYDCLLNSDVSLSELEDSSDDAVTVDIGFTFRRKKILEDYSRPRE